MKLTTTISPLLPAFEVLAELGELEHGKIGLYVAVSRQQVALREFIEPYMRRWNSLVEKCGSGDSVTRLLADGEPNPLWGEWVAARDELLAEVHEIEVQPICLCEFTKAGVVLRSNKITPLLALGLLTLPEGDDSDD